ncbi:MAG TPA: RNA polymerase sigma factor [Myxococcaceae bacterium]|nr:RNA polymerase sigma factor [Myxococcaceae bacterium]
MQALGLWGLAEPMGLGLEERSAADGRIRRAARDGDYDTALRVLMGAYGRQLFAVCTRFIPDRALAEDVHQTCFVQAYHSLHRVLERESIAAWLMAIARNRCLDALKISRRRRRWQVLHATVPEVHDTGTSPEDDVHRRSVVQRLRAALDVLSTETRRAVELRYGEMLSYDEMAELCEARPGTLQMRVTRAMPLLRRSLEAQGITGF